ncbi:MAG: diaminopimelate decarboxylase [Endomicrobium sp.]|nr:diaminopimelate decarboxylase [Endomicrobium sp.]
MLKFKRKDLHIEHVKLLDIAKQYGTPTYVYSKNKIVNNFFEYKNILKSKNDIICFSCKSNSNGTILKLLAKLGSGVDTTSGGEIYRCLRAGFSPSMIVYAGVGKTYEEIEYALKSSIFMFNVESFDELNLIDKIAKKVKAKARISFRINPEIDINTHPYVVTGKNGTKFGIPYYDAIRAYLTAKKKKNIVISGIHFHIGSQILDLKPYKIAADKIKKIVDILELKNGIKLEYINCGGGIGIKYKNNQKILRPKRFISEMFSIFGLKHKMIFEPGRSIVGNAGHLLIKIIYKKSSYGKNFLITNSGMNDLIRPALYNAYHNTIPIKYINTKKIKTDIVGPICETGDFIARDVILPSLKQNDYLLVTCTGAYGASMASQYNSRPLITEVLIECDKTFLMRKRAKYDDLLLNEV